MTRNGRERRASMTALGRFVVALWRQHRSLSATVNLRQSPLRRVRVLSGSSRILHRRGSCLPPSSRLSNPLDSTSVQTTEFEYSVLQSTPLILEHLIRQQHHRLKPNSTKHPTMSQQLWPTTARAPLHHHHQIEPQQQQSQQEISLTRPYCLQQLNYYDVESIWFVL